MAAVAADQPSAPAAGAASATEPDHSNAFGAKTISWWGSFVLNLNNVMGPACVLLPLVNHQAGWLTPMLGLFIIFVQSSFACTMLCEAAQRIPGNHNFAKRVEFCDLVRYYYGQRAYVASQIAYNVSLQASNIAAMIVSAQVLDDFIIHIFGTSYAFDYADFRGIRATVPHGADPNGQVWFDPVTHDPVATVISLGYLLSMLLCIPFGIMKLDENMWFQWLSFGGLLLFTGEFFVQFIMSSVPDGVGYEPGNGPSQTVLFGGNQGQVLGLAMFAYAYVVTIPSWLNEKKSGVSVNSAVWWPALVGFIMKLLIGLLGAWAFAHPTDNILTNLASPPMPQVTRYSSYMWNLLTLVPGIPILAIMVKYNLITGKIVSPFMANILGVVLPWAVTAFCYEQQVLNQLCNWVAILVQGYINFLVPIMLYRRALIEFPGPADGVDWARVRALPDEDGRLSVKAISMRVTSHEHILVDADGNEQPSDSADFSALARAPSFGKRAKQTRGSTASPADGDDDGMHVGPSTPSVSLLEAGASLTGGNRPSAADDEDASSNADGVARQSHRSQRLSHGEDVGVFDREAAGPASARKLRFTDAVDADDLHGEHPLEGGPSSESDSEAVDETPVNAVPRWMHRFMTPLTFATASAVFFSILCTAFVIFNIVESIAKAAS
ncbi:hypothetical protein FNF27_02010 [Cafeteria roenbergensis]|uniref:Amino acid transporter transmembrane domain-containing protein n=1 Tax=Cafeteria roenbergensis TaxID=33653 RepID=A0A5A8DUA4_CAFRO|nr:hypothetical protein FNF31_00009 [Cafeteria roenbergensis]KAA0170622.1 hypothetical protein FNF28_01384 [Cafeteria roenbergensis]KAA0176729.1 hypothetical protein FNF27_02010 [Cafeteria roenbergensis]|mmetsp:Transcript_16210/g.61447  ORF Transcript_16210/g.61447 Transcript_16210/m.61447 type:complete len:665 (+) Transcript_16210:75-2069(+)